VEVKEESEVDGERELKISAKWNESRRPKPSR
jgi:hypothetical protein